MTVDEILAGTRYRDRRGREWKKLIDPIGWVNMSEHRLLTRNQMRLLIERDQHKCDAWGLASCNAHPAVSVTKHRQIGAWLVFDNYGVEYVGRLYHEWSAAMSAARALAVGE